MELFDFGNLGVKNERAYVQIKLRLIHQSLLFPHIHIFCNSLLFL